MSNAQSKTVIYRYPKVLIAQSVVGREGLNLHKTCRNAELIHPVVFKGTYGEHNWRRLQECSDDLRVQIHAACNKSRLSS